MLFLPNIIRTLPVSHVVPDVTVDATRLLSPTHYHYVDHKQLGGRVRLDGQRRAVEEAPR
jgi:hypothetical protein